MKAFSEIEIGRDVYQVTGHDTSGPDPKESTLGDIAPEYVNTLITFPNGKAFYKF